MPAAGLLCCLTLGCTVGHLDAGNTCDGRQTRAESLTKTTTSPNSSCE